MTGGYRRLTHLRLVTAHAHDVLLVPLRLVAAAAARLETEAAGGLPRQRGLRSVVPLAERPRGSSLAAGRFTGHGRSLNF